MIAALKRLIQYRSLLFTLTSRELKARYRGSVFGFVWSLVNPLLLFAVYAVVFGWILGARFEDAEPYAVFLIAGLFPWIWTQSALLEGVASLTGNAGLIRKAVFPSEILPVVSVTANLVHFLFALPIVIGAVLFASRTTDLHITPWILLLPLVIAIHWVLLSGLALLLSALNVHFKDVRDVISNLLTVLFFLAPIIYPLSLLADKAQVVRWVVNLNPFTPFVVAYQDVLFHSRAPEPTTWAAMIGVALVAWILGAGLFERLAETLAEAV